MYRCLLQGGNSQEKGLFVEGKKIERESDRDISSIGTFFPWKEREGNLNLKICPFLFLLFFTLYSTLVDTVHLGNTIPICLILL